GPRGGGRRPRGGRGGGPAGGDAGAPPGHRVKRKQLEQAPELRAGRQIAQDRAGDRTRHDRARDHHLWDADEIEPDERAPHEQEELQLEGHANSSSGTARAVGTSWAVISTPCAASARSLAASASLR